MRYQPIDPNLFITNRQRLRQQLKPGQAVVLRASKGEIGSETEHAPFRQNRDFFWATGLDEPWAAAIVSADSEMLFIKPATQIEQQWNGDRISMETAAKLSGIADSMPLSKLSGYIKDHQLTLVKAAEVLPALRMIKQPAEVELIKQAIAITAAGQSRLLAQVQPGVREYELEAELSYEFTRAGSKHAFEPIIASGQASCTLHYLSNHQTVQDGDLVVVDVGAEYGNYAADITRTYPASGHYSPRQRTVYEAVLRVQQGAMALLKPGLLVKEYARAVDVMMAHELHQLGLVSSNSDPDEIRRYFPHSVSHYLGLDVHDASDYSQPIRVGMVITVEPGIYIAEEGIGVRLEDDVLITEQGAVNLSADIPIEPEEIEALMSQKA